jgi:hypothetical protein
MFIGRTNAKKSLLTPAERNDRTLLTEHCAAGARVLFFHPVSINIRLRWSPEHSQLRDLTATSPPGAQRGWIRWLRYEKNELSKPVAGAVIFTPEAL